VGVEEVEEPTFLGQEASEHAASLAYNAAINTPPPAEKSMNRALDYRIVRLSGDAFARGIGGED
jgi:hypothetical protein